MGISPIHDSRNANGGRIDATMKTMRALKSTKRRQEMGRAAKQELKNAKRQISDNFSSRQFWAKFLKLFAMIAFYFASSIALTFYQKQLIMHIPLPISIVVFHLVAKFFFAAVCRSVYSCKTGQARVVLDWKKYVTNVAPAAVFSALDIGLSQWSFEYITISLYTMTKTTSIIFILFFAIFLKLEEKHWSQIVIVIFISVGLYLFTYRATSFDGLGFSLAFTASFLSGARWTFSQKVLQKSKLNLQNPIDFIYHIQPFMILTILPLAVYVEGSRMVASQFGFRFSTLEECADNVVKIGVGGVMAFFMEVAEFLIVTYASSLTLSIVGVVKEVSILILSIVIKGNHVTGINVAGMIICLFGLSAHVINKGKHECKQKKKSKQRAGRRRNTDGFLRNGGGDNDNHDDAAAAFGFDSSGDDDSEDIDVTGNSYSRRSRARSNFVDVGGRYGSIPLLKVDDDSSSDGEELRTNADSRIGGHRASRHVDDSFYLSDQRRWTGVRDAQLSAVSEK